MNFNNAKILNVYYNKGDRKPYDVNGKPIAYLGEEFIGATEATAIRFHLGESIDSSTAVAVTKRADGERRLDVLVHLGNNVYELVLNDWYSSVKGRAVLSFKAYNGTVTYDDPSAPTEIVSSSGRIVVSDIFNLDIAYAPDATLIVPPDNTPDYASWFFALSSKLDKVNAIYVDSALPSNITDVDGGTGLGIYDGRYYYIKNDEVGKLFYIDDTTAVEVVFGVGTLALTSNGNSDINVGTNAGKMYWSSDRGTIIAGLYDDEEIGIGDSLFFFGKATENIAKGEVVQFAGNTGGNIRIKKAVFSEISAQPDLLMGVAKHAIANNDFGYVVSFGYVRNLNTSAFSTPILYLSTTTPGALSSTKPTTGFKGSIAAVARPSSGGGNDGFLIVRPNLVKGITELADVTITTASNGQVLSYDGSKWVNSNRLSDLETEVTDLKTDLTNGDFVVGKAVSDQNGDTIDTTYLKVATASSTYIPLSQKAQPNGVATLGANGRVLPNQLPASIGEVLEFPTLADFPSEGTEERIYIAIDTNKTYRWSGTQYVEISASLALGETSQTAFAGDRGVALETLTDNIVDGTQTLTDTRITNSAIGVQPLIVNAINGTTANLQAWQINGVNQARLSNGGFLFSPGISNLTSSNNAVLLTSNNGSVISRNIADANPALIVNQANAGSTGDILRLQSAGANVLEVTRQGGLNQNGTRLFHQTANVNNTFFGVNAGNLTLTGAGTTAIGVRALESTTNGFSNTAVGLDSGKNNTTGANNVFIGRDTGRSIIGGSQNTFIGRSAGDNALQLVSATNSTALGNEAYTDKSNQMVYGNASVTEHVFNRNTGATALLPIISVGGTSAFTGVATFNNNIVLAGADRTIINSSNNALSFGTNNLTRMTIRDDGRVGVGTTSPSALFDVSQATNGTILRITSRQNDASHVTSVPYGSLEFFSSDISNGGAKVLNAIRVFPTNAVGGLSRLAITTHDATSEVERISIIPAGLVGINETSPTAQLQVKSGATTRVPLIVDTLASGHTANIVEFSANNSLRVLVGANGLIRTTNGLANMNSANNSNIAIGTSGTNISRDVADTNPALIVNLQNASATGPILVLQRQGNAVSSFDNFGTFVGQTRPDTKEETGNYTLALADEGKVLRVNSSSNRTITIPANSTLALPVGTEIAIIRMGTGTVSISPASGVTLNSVSNNRKIKDRYGSVALKKIGTDEWVLAGSLEA